MTTLATILIIVGVLLIIQIFFKYYFWRKRSEMITNGEILEDEFSQMVKHKAGYRTYWISWFMWLGIYLFDSMNDIFFKISIQSSWVIWIGVMIMWAIYNGQIFFLKRDRVE